MHFLVRNLDFDAVGNLGRALALAVGFQTIIGAIGHGTSPFDRIGLFHDDFYMLMILIIDTVVPYFIITMTYIF